MGKMFIVFRSFLLVIFFLGFSQPSFAKKRRILDLSNKNISDVSSLEIPKSTRVVFLDGNQISNLEGLNLPSKLKNLILSDNQITSLSSLPLSTSIKDLSLTGNPLVDISSLENFETLEKLFLRDTLLDSSNFDISKLPPSLKTLSLSINLFDSLDLSMVLNLDFLRTSPGKVNGVDSLIGADYSKIKFPEDVETIVVGSVSLKDDFTGLTLPNELPELKMGFMFMELDELLTLEFSPNLKLIDLRGNLLSSLEGIDFPDTLEVLNLNKNELTSLDDVDIPASIKVLNLKNNNFSKAEKRKIKKRFGKKVKIKF